jgi:large subunit ribosomal protein L30
MIKVKITQMRSKNHSTEKQRAALRSLGLNKIHQSKELFLNDMVKGQVAVVSHLLKVEELGEEEVKMKSGVPEKVEYVVEDIEETKVEAVEVVVEDIEETKVEAVEVVVADIEETKVEAGDVKNEEE